MANDQSAVKTRNEFGTFAGVFTPCILTILGVVLFMRANFVLGHAGILSTILILLMAKSITFLTALSTSAIGTNMQVRGGGAYYLISRVLGPEFGGAIGIVLFLAQAISIPFYVLGFTEALVQTFPGLGAHHQAIAFGTAAALLVVTFVGAGWAIRVQYVIMASLVLSILVFMAGGVRHFTLDTFFANWGSAFSSISADTPEAGSYTFWGVFAIYFPAVTGIMAGINMSGDLKDPARSIPRGTLAAIGVGLIVYFAQILVFAGAFERETLISQPYLLLKENALFGLGILVALGMFAATLSSGLGSFMGAPRVLQAVARDGILRPLRPFAKGTQKGDEPRRAVLAAGLLSFVVLYWAGSDPEGQALNIVAQTITMFFLYTYGMLNIAAFIETVGANPSFRPTFKYYHWSTALAGGLGCIAVAFVIAPLEACVAILLLAGLVWHLSRRQWRATFGDARRGFLFKTARDSLLSLARMEETPKNWRPTSLVFSGQPEAREQLVDYAVWLEAGRGIAFLANVLVGDPQEYAKHRNTARKALDEFCRKRNIEAFPVVVVDRELEHGMAAILQSLGIGPIRPNVVVFGWSGDQERLSASVRSLRLAADLGASLVVVQEGQRPFKYGRKRVDVWWRGMKNGGLMVLLAHLLTRNWEWSRTDVRLLRVIGDEAGRAGTAEDLQKLLEESRIEASVKVITSGRPFADVLHQESSDADCVFLGFEIPEEADAANWHRRYQDMLHDMPTIILVSSQGIEDIRA